jgi:hypothetical protein
VLGRSAAPTFIDMSSYGRLYTVTVATALAACRGEETVPSPARLVAEQVAKDTASRAWRHLVGVDSVRMRGDTAVVWVSPRNWRATDAPQAGVHVTPDGRVAAVQWVLGG